MPADAISNCSQLVPEREKRFFRGLRFLGGVQQRLVGKGPIEELGGLAEDVLAVGAQNHKAVGVAVLLGKGDEAPARFGGEARLHAVGVGAVIRAVRPQ